MGARVVVTGANSAIGRVVVARALERADLELVAAVRSPRAAAQLPQIPAAVGRVALVDYEDAAALAAALAGASALIHLPGLLIETRESPYERANVATTRAALAAAHAAGVGKVVLQSACGADARARNRFFRSKGEAEELVRGAGLPYTILRCPLVLGCGGAGDLALARQARSRLVALLGGGVQLEQPIDARDVSHALLGSAVDAGQAPGRTLDLVGPECLEMRELVRRAAALEGRSVTILPIPLWLGRAAARLSRGGVTPDVIEVLTGHVPYDPTVAAQALGLELTPLDVLLRRSLASAVRA
jgi:NADH dehydrogenase